MKLLLYFLNRGLLILLSFLSLWTGAMIYIYVRKSTPTFISYLDFAGIRKIFGIGKDHFSNLNFPEWIVLILPSCLWAFAYSLIITGIWWLSNSWLKKFWIASIFFLAIGWEIFQILSLIPGTFSVGDIISGLIGASLGMLLAVQLVK